MKFFTGYTIFAKQLDKLKYIHTQWPVIGRATNQKWKQALQCTDLSDMRPIDVRGKRTVSDSFQWLFFKRRLLEKAFGRKKNEREREDEEMETLRKHIINDDCWLILILYLRSIQHVVVAIVFVRVHMYWKTECYFLVISIQRKSHRIPRPNGKSVCMENDKSDFKSKIYVVWWYLSFLWIPIEWENYCK